MASHSTSAVRRRFNQLRISAAIGVVADLVALTTVAALSGWSAAVGLFFVLVTLGVLALRGHYLVRSALQFTDELSTIGTSVAVSGFVLAVATEPDSGELLARVGLAAAALVVARLVTVGSLRLVWDRGWLRARTAIIGTGSLAREVAIDLDVRRHLGVDVVGFVGVPGEEVSGLDRPVLGEVMWTGRIADQHGLDRVIVATPDASPEIVSEVRQLAARGITVYILPTLHHLGVGSDSLKADRVRGYALMRLNRSPHPEIGRAAKRLFDLVGASLALVLVAPVAVAVAVAVRVTSPGPVLFRQKRVGRDGRTFELLKFRSMTVGADSDHAWTPEMSVATYTPIGRFLRASSLDELPQLLNIVRGEMSFVGPRPERPIFVEEFSRTIPGYADRHRMTVGLTGLAQVVGLRGDTPMRERAKFDNLYIDQWTFTGDLAIILRTFWAIVRQRRYADIHNELQRRLEACTPPTPADLPPSGHSAAVNPSTEAR